LLTLYAVDTAKLVVIPRGAPGHLRTPVRREGGAPMILTGCFGRSDSPHFGPEVYQFQHEARDGLPGSPAGLALRPLDCSAANDLVLVNVCNASLTFARMGGPETARRPAVMLGRRSVDRTWPFQRSMRERCRH